MDCSSSIQPSAIYLFLVKHPKSLTAEICYHFNTKFEKIMPLLETMEQDQTLTRTYAYPGRMSQWSAKR